MADPVSNPGPVAGLPPGSSVDDFSSGHMTRVARRLIAEVFPVRWKILLVSFFCMLGVAGFTGALANATKLIVDDVFAAGDISAAYRVAGIIAAIAVFKAGFQYANTIITVIMRRGIAVDYQKRLFAHTVQMDMAHFGGQQPATQMFLIKNLGASSGNAFVYLCNQITVEALTVIALFIVMLLQNPLLTLMCSACVPVVIGLVAWLSARVRAVATQEAGAAGLYFAIGTEILRGIKTVKSYQLEEKSRARFNAGLDVIETLMLRFARVTSATLPAVEFLGGLVIGLFVIFASWQVTTTDATAGEFTAFITAFLLAYKPAERLSHLWVKTQQSLVFVARMYELLDAKPQSKPYGVAQLDEAKEPLNVENVHFSYDENAPTLHDITLRCKPAERLAVVGKSGAGKSTLIDILQRFYDPNDGAVCFGDVDLQSLSKTALHDHISLISQDVFLFDGTIAENIRDGRADATREEIEAAARHAGLGDVIDDLPDGLDAAIGPNGSALSGGQRQRLAIARGIVKKAGLYIFDEVTSALDTQTEREVLTHLAGALSDATLIFVTHRAAPLSYVDRILVLNEGRVEAFGTREEVARDSAVFQTLFGAADPLVTT